MRFRTIRLGRDLKIKSDADLFRRGRRAGRLGEGGGENKRWLKLRREDVAEKVEGLRS